MSQILYLIAILCGNLMTQFQLQGYPTEVEFHQNLKEYHVDREGDTTNLFICRFYHRCKDFLRKHNNKDWILNRGYAFIIRKRKERTSDVLMSKNILHLSSCCFLHKDHGHILNIFLNDSIYFSVQYEVLRHLKRKAINKCDRFSVILDSSLSKTYSTHNTRIQSGRRKRDLVNESSTKQPSVSTQNTTKANVSISPNIEDKTEFKKTSDSKTSKTTASSSKSTYTLSEIHLNSTDINEVRRDIELQISRDPYWAFLCVVTVVILTLYLVYWTRMCQNSRSDLQYIEYVDHVHLTDVHDAVIRKAKFLDIFRKWKKTKKKHEKSFSENEDDCTQLLDTTDTEDVLNI